MPFSIVKSKVFFDNTGSSVSLPVIITEHGPLLVLIDYCLSVNKSLSRTKKLVRAVKLFLEYVEVNASSETEEWRLFRNFSNALRLGTIDAETGMDSSGLYWQPISAPDSRYFVSMLSEFFDWLGDIDPSRSRVHKFNPRYKGGRYEQRIDKYAYQYARSKAFLGHIWSENPSTSGRRTRVKPAPKVLKDRPPSFPEDRFDELLFKGFYVNGNYDWRGMLLTLLLFGGGLRSSEPFHIYLSDVQPHWNDNSLAFVAIHHPSLGAAPDNWRNSIGHQGTRREYLAAEWGLVPRNEVLGKSHAGWKNPALDAKWYMQVHWFPENYGRLFLQIWARYMEQVASIERSHPYAFINLEKGNIGELYKVDSYCRALQGAVERIGLEYGKQEGTTPHGGRHAYGQRLKNSQVNKVVIQRVMHHASPDSQIVYTQSELNEAAKSLSMAATLLQGQQLGNAQICFPKDHLPI